MCFPEIVIKMIQYLVGLVLRGLISTFVYVLITDDRLFQLPLNHCLKSLNSYHSF